MPFSLSSMFRPSGTSTSSANKSSATPSTSHFAATSTSSPSSTPLADSLTLLIAFLRSPLWRVPLSSFIDAHCLYFDTSAEHQLQHTDIHHSYVALCESLLESHLDAVGLSQSAFVALCEAGLQSADGAIRRLIGEVLLLDEYPLFHKRMVQRNIELDAQVLADCLAQQSAQKNKDKQRDRQRAAHDEGRRQHHDGGEDEEALRMAIQLSLLEEESTKKEREREAAEIEYTIQLSLALQAEELRQAEEKQSQVLQQQQQQQQPTHEHRQTQHTASPMGDAQQKSDKVEEEKEVAPPVAPLPVAAPPISSSSPPPTSASLGPLKHLRRVYERNVERVEAAREERATAAATSVQPQEQQQPALSTAAGTSDESAARHDFLRLKRERLIARNKEAGTKQLSAFKADLAATEQAVQQQRDQQKQQTNSKAASISPVIDAKRVAMEAVLKARLRGEAEKTIASRTEQRSLDEQLQMLQSLTV